MDQSANTRKLIYTKSKITYNHSLSLSPPPKILFLRTVYMKAKGCFSLVSRQGKGQH